MEDLSLMESPQTPHNLDEDIPDLLLFDVGLSLLVVADLLEHVAIVCILHDEAETGSRFINESISVGDNVWVVNGGEDTNLIERILLLFLGEAEHLYVLERVDIVVIVPPHLEYTTVGTITKLFYDGEV